MAGLKTPLHVADKSSYKKGLKGISVFGGLQIYKILISVATTKISAIFLGPAGVAIYGLYTSTLTTIESLTSCGLGISAVKDIAQSKDSPEIVAQTFTVLNRLVWIVGLLGFLICLIFARQLSELSFDSPDYAWGFRVLSITLIGSQLISGQGVLIVGLSKYRLAAKLRLWVGLLTLVASATLYFILGKEGIVPVIFTSSVIYLVLSILTVRRIKLPKIKINWKGTWRIGYPMFKAGILLSISWLLTSICAYVIRVYIGRVGDDVTLGLFISSFSLVNTYLGLIFSSIESDFYPRLSATKGEKITFKSTASSELELVYLLIAPLVCLLIVFSLPILQIFYSSKFLGAKEIIIWTAVSMVLKVPGWIASVGLMSLGRNKMFMNNQLIYNIYQLGLNLLGFYYGGLIGVGITYSIGCLIYSIQSILVLRRAKYSAVTREGFILAFALTVGVITVAIWATVTNNYALYLGGTLGVVIISSYSIIQLNKRIGILQLVKSRFNR